MVPMTPGCLPVNSWDDKGICARAPAVLQLLVNV